MSEPVENDQIKSIVERIQRLTEERKTIADDIAEVYAEAKANGFDKAAIKWVVSELEKPFADREERDAIRELYMQAATQPSRGHVQVRGEAA